MSITVTLAVADLDRTATFYREVLGLHPDHLTPDGGRPLLCLRYGDANLLFRETSALEASHPALFQNLDRHPSGVGMSLEFTLSDLAPVEREVARRGLHLLYELEDDEHHRREFWLHDPDGYLVILLEEAND